MLFVEGINLEIKHGQTNRQTDRQTQLQYPCCTGALRVMNAQSAETSVSARARIYNTRAWMLERHMRLKLKIGSVHCWKHYSFDRSSTHA